MESSWLKVSSVSKGMFPGEFTVVTSTSDGREFSLFAPAEYVDSKNQRIRVGLLECAADACLVYLPVSPVDLPSRTVKVSAREVIRG